MLDSDTSAVMGQAGADGVYSSALDRALNVVGDPWSLQILRAAFMGITRFQDFKDELKLPRQTLILRLNRLTDESLFYKRPVHSPRLVFEYVLTPKGLDLYPFIIVIWRWHQRWAPDSISLPKHLNHDLCGQSLVPMLVGRCCNEPLFKKDIRAIVRSGAEAIAEMSQEGRRVRLLKGVSSLGVATVVIGDRWSILVLGAVMRGMCNYDSMHKFLNISSNVLSSRLKTLLELDLLSQVQDDVDKRRLNYSMTEKGWDVYPMILSLVHWADRWLAGSRGPDEVYLHTSCGKLTEPVVICQACQHVLHPSDVSIAVSD